jgi:DNA-binding protein H-NS
VANAEQGDERPKAALVPNPKNRSETWAGRGAMPRWLAAEIKKGKKREDFAIKKST